MSDYTIIDTCRDDADLRAKFFNFTRFIYPTLDFTEWYARGFWQDEYVPHAIVKDNRIVSNVAATRMNLIINGEEVRGVQIGTVGTVPEYRGRGLSRLLMEHVIDKYRDSTDIMFLFADEEVLDFYPKFGFNRHHASLFRGAAPAARSRYSARRLNVQSDSDMALVATLLRDRMTLTRRFGAFDYAFITQWHLLNILPDDLFYIGEADAVLAVRGRNGALHVLDVICREPFDLTRALAGIVQSRETTAIVYHFPPDQLQFEFDVASPDDECPLYIRGDFAVTDRYFKFPVTAHT